MSTETQTFAEAGARFVLCLERGDYRASLTVGRVYRVAPAEDLDPADRLRVIDDSGEGYLFPASWFDDVSLSARAKKALSAA